MTSPAHLKVLRQIHERLAGSGIRWCLTGSLALALQGVPVEVHDVDLKSDQAGVYEMERLFAEYVARRVEFSAKDAIRSHLGALAIDGIKVEIMGDVQTRQADGGWSDATGWQAHVRTVTVEGMEVPVVSLEYEYRSYLAMGRADKVELLRRWMPLENGEPAA